ncbi:uncharacterized protein LOC143606673 [Bidens hawaiensis]|uniref:uncharacterized protein LOC143606673 n=1 Tax=Bidens hawaiensis TaxID=980011 RepID=UPI004048F610
MRQRCWVELLNDYECAINYHPAKATVVDDALSRKETKPRRVRALQLIVHSVLPNQIRSAQLQALIEVNKKFETFNGADKNLELKSDGLRHFMDRVWVSLYGDLRELVMDEAHRSIYSVHLGSEKMYHDLKTLY